MRKMYYVSHPYTGDEEKNKKEAREITATLKNEYPAHIFINPLDTFQYTEGWPYEKALKNCIELLGKCDGIIMTGDWEHSRGCKKEKEVADQLDIEITELHEWL